MIKTDSVRAGYRNFKLEDISLDIPEKRFIALAGANGSGKSTLIKVLGGVLSPEKGSVRINGKNLKDLSLKERGRSISHIPPEFKTDFPFTVREIVLMGRNVHIPRFASYSRKDYDIADKAMEDAGCLDTAERFVTSLSSGQRQLALLARAISQDTTIMLLDEPSSHLDPAQASRVYGLLKRLSERGKMILAVMHDLTAAANYSDEIIFMKEGRILRSGETKDTILPEILRGVFGVEFRVTKTEGGVFIRTENLK